MRLRDPTYYYNEETDLCVGHRQHCEHADDAYEYDDIQSCINENLRPGYVKTVEMYCTKGSGVVKDPKTDVVLIANMCHEPNRFCGVDENCLNATTYAYCCKENLPDNSVKQEFSPMLEKDAESRCLEKKIKFFYDEDERQCLGYRDGCEHHDESYETIEECARSPQYEKAFAHRVVHKSYWCMTGYTPSIVSTSAGVEFPLQAITTCDQKQFCDSEQICMQRSKLGYCCDKGSPSFRKFAIKKLP